MEAAELRSSLQLFTGTTAYYQHWTKLIVYTDGVRYLANAASAFWLLDAIALAQPRALRDPWLREFQLWELFTRTDHSATLVCSRDTDSEAFRREIAFTDFPIDYVRLYVEGNVLLLPSEH
jgi:hypothetical protein